MSFQDLRNAKPDLWTTAGTGWGRLSGETMSARTDLAAEAAKLKGTWTGPAGQNAVATMTSQANEFQAASIELKSVQEILDGLGSGIGIAQRTLNSAVANATQLGLTVDDNGDVITQQGTRFQPGLCDVAPASDPQAAAAQRIANLIGQAVEAATNVDQWAARQLNHLAGTTNQTDVTTAENDDQVWASQAEVGMIGHQVPPAGTDPATVAAWWAGLTPQQQQQLQLAVPQDLAHLNGLPATVTARLNATRAGFSPEQLVEWANRNWNNDSLDIPDVDNCTNFASDGLAAAGLGKHDPLSDVFGDHHSTDDWSDDDSSGWWGSGKTRTWTDADDFHQYMDKHGGYEVPLSQAQPGDVLVWTQDGANPSHPDIKQGEGHHAAIVTSVTPDGDIKYTQHTGNMLNGSLNGREPNYEAGDGSQQVHVIRIDPANAPDPYQQNPAPTPVPDPLTAHPNPSPTT